MLLRQFERTVVPINTRHQIDDILGAALSNRVIEQGRNHFFVLQLDLDRLIAQLFRMIEVGAQRLDFCLGLC